MRKRPLLAAIGMLGVVTAAAGCGTSSPGPAASSADESVRKYLGADGGPNGLLAWETKVGKAICQLEVQNPTGLDPALRMCTAGPPDLTPPPKYPPPDE